MAKNPWDEDYETESSAPWEAEYEGRKMPTQARGRKADPDRQLAIDVANANKDRPMTPDYMEPPPLGAPLKSAQASPWATSPFVRFPRIRSNIRGGGETRLGSEQNPYPVGSNVPDDAYVKTKDGGTVLNEMSNMEALGGILARGGLKAKEMAQSFIPTSSLDGAQARLKEIQETGGYTVGLGERSRWVKATPEEIKQYQDISNQAITELGGNRKAYNEASAEYLKSSERLNLERDISNASGFGESVSALANPATFGLLTESLVSSTPMIAAAALTRNPAYLAVIGGAGAGSQEYAIGVADYLEQNGVNPETATPEQIQAALEYTNSRTAIVGGAGALGNIVAGTRLIPQTMTKTPAKALLANAGAQTGLGTLIEGGGEAAAGAATGNFNWTDTLLESAAGGVTAPIEATQVLREAYNLSKIPAQTQPVAPETQVVTPQAPPQEVTPLGEIGRQIEAQAEAQGIQQAQAQRSFSEAGTAIDNRLQELQTATKPRLDKAEAKALQNELQDIVAVLREQEQMERSGVIRTPENNLSADQKKAYGQRQIEIKAKLEAHRAAGSAESQLRALESRLSKIDNDGALLALANELTPLGSVAPVAEAAQPATQPQPEVAPEALGGLDEIVQSLGGIQNLPIDEIITELGGAINANPPEGDAGLNGLLAAIQPKSGTEKPASPKAKSSPLSENETKAGLASGTMGNEQGNPNPASVKKPSGTGSGADAVKWSATKQQDDSPTARAGFTKGAPTVETTGSKIAQRVFDAAGFDDTSVREVAKDSMPPATARLIEGIERVTGTQVVVYENSTDTEVPNGFYHPRSNSIYVANDAETIVSRILAHEFTHWLETHHPEKLFKLKAIVAKYGDIHGHANFRNYKADPSWDVETGISELTADLTGDAMNDIEFMESVADEDPAFWKGLLIDFINFLDDMMAKFGKQDTLESDRFMSEVEMFRDELKKVLVSLGEEKSAKIQPDNGAKNDPRTTDSQVSSQASARKVRQSGRVGRSPESVELDRGKEYSKSAEGEQPTTLAGLPRQVIVDGRTVEFGGFKTAQDAAKRYMEQAGLEYNPPTRYAQVDTERAKAIADEFSAMAHNPSDPQVKRAYAAMISETLAQYQAILDTGLKVEFITGADPYGNPRNAIIDIVENNHFWVFPTDDGFGSSNLDVSDNPLLAETEYTISGKPALANDIFRVVHDYFGHAKEGVGFRATGEENAWRSHSAMYSPLARKAMATETRGQNSWVNFGKYGEQNRTASPSDTVYADQKVGLLPDWVVNDDVKFSRKKGTMANGKETAKTDSDGQSGVSRPVQSEVKQLPKLDIGKEIPTFTQRKPNKAAVKAYGVHFSPVGGINKLKGSKAGQGSAGAERRRFGMTNFGEQASAGDTARRAYFYVQDTKTVPRKENSVQGDNRYVTRLDNLYDHSADPLGLWNETKPNVDAYEEAVNDAGFDGILFPDIGQGISSRTAVVFGLSKDIPVVSFSRRQKPIMSMNDFTYSALARLVDGAPLKTVAADQWQKWIAANGQKTGVKSDEIEWTGINEWLALQDGKVSKEAVQEYLKNNGVQVSEVQKGSDNTKLPDGWRIVDQSIDEELDDAYLQFIVLDEEGEIRGEGDTRGDALRDASDPDYLEEFDTKFNNEDWRVAGGENYREVVLTLPKPSLEKASQAMKEFEQSLNSKPMSDAQKKEWERLGNAVAKAKGQSKSDFTDSHWDEPNVLAHIRLGEHKDADGNRVLFVYEIQSDWGQKGRKDGFEVKAISAEKIGDVKTIDGNGLRDRYEQEWKVTLSDGSVQTRSLPRGVDPLLGAGNKDGAPRAPFVTDTKAWVGLAIKRVAAMAVEEGFDKVVFANGQQAADYFDLSKSVSRVTYWKNSDGTYGLYAYAKTTGEQIVGEQKVQESKLEDYVGKEIAKKITETAPTKGDKTISGLDLKVGGEGMKAFYDRLVPQVANDVLKKLGGGKVETVNVVTDNEAGEDAYEVVLPNGKVVHTTSSKKNANATASQFEGATVRVIGTIQSDQLGFTITPEMKSKVANSDVPLFSRRYNAPAGWNYDTNSWEGYAGQLKKARETLQDKMLSWRDVQSAIEKGTGSPVEDAQNVYRLENLMHGRVSGKMKELERDHYVPISKEINRLGIKTDDLQKYLIARHAPERNARIASINPKMPDGGSGMSTADANAYIAGLSAQEKSKLNSVAVKVDALIKDTLKRQFDSGLIDKEAYLALTSMYKHYVPLRGTDDEFAKSGMGTGQGLDGRGKVIKAALGRGEGNEAANVLGEVIGDSQRSVITSEKARVGRALMRLVLANPSPLWSVEPVQTMRYLDSNGEVAEKIVQDWSDPSIIAVKHDGKTYKVQVNDPRLMAGLKSLGDAHLGGILTATAKVNRYLSAVLTQYNPAFIPVNASRDMIFGLTGLAAEHGALAAAQSAAHYPQAAAAAYQLARGKTGTGEWATWAQEFSGAGGKTGYVHMESVEDLQNKLGSGKLGSFDPQGIRKVASGFADAVSHLNDGVENALRLSAYVTLRKRGMSIEKAAEYAKNMTVNFNRKGTHGTQINALLLFFNASAQGAARSLKVMKNPKAYAYLGTMAALQGVAAMAALGMKEEDEDDSLWDKIPDHVKRRNLVIPLDSSHYATIPMPYGMNVFTYATSKTIDAMTNKGQRPEQGAGSAVADIMNAAVESFSPIPLDEGAWGITPQILRPFLNVSRNKDGLGREIRREKPFDRANMPLASLGKPDTMEIFKITAKGLNRIGGGNDYTPPPFSLFDRAPEDIEYILREFSGGAGKFVIDVAAMGEKAYAGADLTMRDIPIAKRFVTSVDDVATQQAMYYERTESIARSLNEMKDIYKADGEAAAQEFIDKTPALSGVNIVGTTDTGNPKLKPTSADSLYGIYKATEKAIDERNDSFRAAYNDAPASFFPNAKTVERDKAIKEANKARADQQREFNRAWNQHVVSIAE